MSNSKTRSRLATLLRKRQAMRLRQRAAMFPANGSRPKNRKRELRDFQAQIDESKIFNGGQNLQPHLAGGTVQGPALRSSSRQEHCRTTLN